MNNLKNTGKVIGAILVGSLLGAMGGIIFASCRGCKSRNWLSCNTNNTADDFRKEMKEEADVLRRQAEELESLAEE